MNQGSELPWLGGRPERCPLGGRLMTHRTHSWGEKDNIWGDWRVHPLIHCETNYIRLLNLGLALSKGTMELELVGKMSHGLENGWYWLVGSNPGKAWGLTWVRKIRELFPKASKSETIKSLFDDGPQFWGTHCRTHSDRIETYHRMAELYTVPHFSFFSWCHQCKVVFSIVVRNFSTLALHKSPGEYIISCKVYIIHGFRLVCFHPQCQPFHLQYKVDILVGHPLSFCFPRTERSTRWCCCTNGFCRCWCPIWKSLQTALGSRTRNRWSKSR